MRAAPGQRASRIVPTSINPSASLAISNVASAWPAASGGSAGRQPIGDEATAAIGEDTARLPRLAPGGIDRLDRAGHERERPGRADQYADRDVRSSLPIIAR